MKKPAVKTNKPVKKIDLFYRLDALFNKKSLELTETSSDGFIILRFLATDHRFVELCEEMSIKLGTVGSKRVCEFLQTLLPRNSHFRPSNYFKSLKFPDAQILDAIADNMLCTTQQAAEYYQILLKQGFDLSAHFGINDNIKAIKKKVEKQAKPTQPEKPEPVKRSKLCIS